MYSAITIYSKLRLPPGIIHCKILHLPFNASEKVGKENLGENVCPLKSTKRMTRSKCIAQTPITKTNATSASYVCVQIPRIIVDLTVRLNE